MRNDLRVRQQGFTLVEVLVAIVIAAFGLLGVAAMQGGLTKASKVSQLRTVATQASSDLSDRMRVNVEGYRTGQYATAGAYAARAGQRPAVVDCVLGCLPDVVAAKDLSDWQRAIADRLPDGAGFVTGSVAAGFTIVVAWREPRTVSDEVLNG